jgi:4-amino-4-deoxy-L-arabinose transferase-like glycosyltransferase
LATPLSEPARRAGGGLAARLGSLIDAVADPARRGRAVPVVLGVYVLVWTLYAVIAKGSQDVHFDMAEAVVWGREAPFGTPKHPPLSGWLAGLWFDVFPRQDWAFYLLAMVMVGIALWFAWRVMLTRLSGDKLAVGLAMLTLVPFFNFQALKYNANTVMIPLWAFATWTFVRSFQSRTVGWAVLAGVAAGLAMLGKYWGVVLLAGFGLAALIDSRRAAYFRSLAPWVSIVSGGIVLAPHLLWVAANGFETFGYALESHRRPLGRVIATAPDYLTGAIAYVIVPLLIVVFAARFAKGGLKDTLWPSDPDRRFLWLIFVIPLVLPVAIAVATRSEAVSLWAMGSMTLLPVVLLSSPLVAIPRRAARRTIAFAIAFPLLALAAAPVAAVVIHRQGVENSMAHYKALARAAEELWQTTSPAPLRLVGGEDHIINGVAFYAAEAPATYDVLRPQVTPWTDAARIARDGIVWICPSIDTDCLAAIEARAAGQSTSQRTDVTLARDYLGTRGQPARYVLIAVPPER